MRQRQDELSRRSGVRPLFCHLCRIPERPAVAGPASTGHRLRQHDLGMIDATPAGIVVHDTVAGVRHDLPGAVSCRRDGAPALGPAERLHAEMIDRHSRSVGQH